MDNLSNIRENIDSNMTKLKREWKEIRSIWKDAKAKEYEKSYLVPIVNKQGSLSSNIKALEKISDELEKLGVDI